MTKAQLLSIAVLVGAFALFARCPQNAGAEPSDALTLSRAIVSEAGYSPGDETWAILHVLEWRRLNVPALRGLTVAQVARRYCSELNGRARTERAERTRALTSADIPDEIEADVRAWLGGERPANPCDGAVHWAARGFRRDWSSLRVRCDGRMQNEYFRGER